MLQFENTKVAFADKSNSYLKKAKFIFRMVASPRLVKVGSSLLRFAILIRFPVKWMVKPTIFSHFCGGETISECESSIGNLSNSNIKSILDYSAEGLQNEKSFDKTTEIILSIIKKASVDVRISQAVFKPTGIARFKLLEKVNNNQSLTLNEADEFQRVQIRFAKICDYAAKHNVALMIDAEESWIQNTIDRLVENEMMKHNKTRPLIYNTVQLYRKDRLKYMTEFSKKAFDSGYFAAFKLVRGAYLEKENDRAEDLNYDTPIHTSKRDTDTDFDKAIKFCIDNIDRMAVCIGTHNEDSVRYAVSYMELKNIPKDNKNVYFAQLYGMSDNISYNLAAEGYNVSKYVPYGPVKLVLPYLIRRAEENTSVAGQTSRELELIQKEIMRRRAKS
ncbi:MAG: proline dehydrogenase family protein [Bacteroidetes bacterium]|nr:proline dehydrogenase family protein [Bacteroidota bacterium]